MNIFGLPFQVQKFVSYIVYLLRIICIISFLNIFPTFLSAHTFIIWVFPHFINSVFSKLFILFFHHHLPVAPLFHFSPSSNNHTVVLSKNSSFLFFFFAQSSYPCTPHSHTRTICLLSMDESVSVLLVSKLFEHKNLLMALPATIVSQMYLLLLHRHFISFRITESLSMAHAFYFSLIIFPNYSL